MGGPRGGRGLQRLVVRAGSIHNSACTRLTMPQPENVMFFCGVGC